MKTLCEAKKEVDRMEFNESTPQFIIDHFKGLIDGEHAYTLNTKLSKNKKIKMDVYKSGVPEIGDGVHFISIDDRPVYMTTCRNDAINYFNNQ